MSRGLGSLQLKILDILKQSSEPVTFESLRWDTTGGKNSNHVATKRSVDLLVKQEHIIENKRKLLNFKEVVSYYPGKTKDSKVRELRLQLLPELQKAITNREFTPKYGIASNEEKLIKGSNSETMLHFQKEWTKLEVQLRQYYGGCANDKADSFLKLICRGKYLFDPKWGLSIDSFKHNLEEVISHLQSNSQLVCDLTSFKSKVMPDSSMTPLKLKGYLHTFTYLSDQNGPPSLNKETLDFIQSLNLSNQDELLITEDHKGPFFPQCYTPTIKPTTHLKKLIDRKVFEQFTFLKLAQ